MAVVGKPVVIENATLIYKNFRGEKSQFNAEGKRNFGVILDEETYERMLADGVNVKRTKVREEELEEDPQALGRPWVPVEARFDIKPPKIVQVTGRGKTLLEQSQVGELDWAEIQNVDLSLDLSSWEFAGNTGVKAYLRQMFVTLDESPLDEKYADLPSQ